MTSRPSLCTCIHHRDGWLRLKFKPPYYMRYCTEYQHSSLAISKANRISWGGIGGQSSSFPSALCRGTGSRYIRYHTDDIYVLRRSLIRNTRLPSLDWTELQYVVFFANECFMALSLQLNLTSTWIFSFLLSHSVFSAFSTLMRILDFFYIFSFFFTCSVTMTI